VSQASVAPVPQAAPPVAVLLRLLALPVLGFVGFGVALALGLPANRIGLLGVAIAMGTLVLSVVAVDRSRPRQRRNLLLSIFSFSYFVFFVLPIFVFYLGPSGYTPEASPNPIPLTPEVVTRGALAALVGYAMLLAGYALPAGAMMANVVPRMRREWSAETALAVALLMLPMGWAVVLVGEFGLIPERAGSGVLGVIAQAASFGIGLIALCYLRYRSRAALVVLVLVSPPTMAFNFFTSSKILFLVPLVMIAVAHVIVTRRLRAWWIAGFLVIMSLFYPVAEIYREYLFGNRLTAVQVIASPERAFGLLARFTSISEPLEYLQTGLDMTARRLDGVGILSVIVRDAGTRVPFQGGWSIGYVPLAYIPRLLWPGKPKFTIGQWVTDNFGYGPHIRSSTGATWMGELYYNFGWPGIVVGMAFLGVWFRFLQESFLGIDATIPAMLAGIVTILALATGVGGDLLGATNRITFPVAPIVLAHLVVRAITPPPARPPPPM
jgi:hypothetical protein